MSMLLLLSLASAGDAPFAGYLAPAWALNMEALDENRPSLEGRVLDAYHGDFVDPNVLAERLKSARVVLIGEDHENALHHKAVARLLYRAVQPDAVVAMRRPKHDAAAVAVDRARGRLVRALPPGPLDEQLWTEREELPMSYSEAVPTELPGEDQVARLVEWLEADSCGELAPEEAAHDASEAVLAQAWMARTVKDQQDPVFLLADQLDVHRDAGVPSYLDDDGVVTVVLYALPRDGEPREYLEYEHADYVWFTDGARRRDRCRG